MKKAKSIRTGCQSKIADNDVKTGVYSSKSGSTARAYAQSQRPLPGASLLKDVAPREHQHHDCRHNQKRRLSCGALQKTGMTVLITLHCHR